MCSLLLALGLALAGWLADPPLAHARQSDEHTYGYDQLWRAAVRLIAVDFRFPITERDPEIGYLLFDYVDQGRSHSASLELVRTRVADGSDRVRVVVHVGTMPGYVERMMLDRFRRKLQDDYGPPPVARPAPRPAPAPAPAEGDEDEDEEPAAPSQRS
jgi:hypothetical protein